MQIFRKLVKNCDEFIKKFPKGINEATGEKGVKKVV